jgi:hypothetical protein
MSICTEKVPPLYRTDERRVAACYLYQDAPVAEHNAASIFE